MKVFVIIQEDSDYRDVSESIKRAIYDTKTTLLEVEETISDDFAKGINEIYLSRLKSALNKADVILADVSTASAHVMYELGVAKSLNRPIILLCSRGSDVPADLNNSEVIYYERTRLYETLLSPLREILKEAENVEGFVSTLMEKKQLHEPKTVFISYSHVDKEIWERLRVHLKPFEKVKLIDVWSDIKIQAGDKWKEQIEVALRRSAIAILLISADFLASDFINDNELPLLLKGADNKGKIILSVIVNPCRFKSNEILSEFYTMNNPDKPLSDMSESEREWIYVKIADRIASLI